MSELAFRPRFRFGTPLGADEVEARIRTHLEGPAGTELRLGGTVGHLVIDYHPGMQRSWSPQLDVDLSTEEGRTMVRCQIGPAPSIWMLFVGGYLLCVILTLLGTSIGVSQQIVGAEPWGYLMVLPAPFLAIALFILARIGKERAREQTHRLKRALDEALGCDCIALADLE
jgi:hypothetical protein